MDEIFFLSAKLKTPYAYKILERQYLGMELAFSNNEYKEEEVIETYPTHLIKRKFMKYGDRKVDMDFAESPEGLYIGRPEDADNLVNKHGITKFICIYPTGNVASVGYSDKDGKWYGWSHRAIYGFKAGDEIKQDTIGYDNSRGKGKPYKLKDEADAKAMAIRFSNDVS